MNRTSDTSVLVPALVSWHPDHHSCREALSDVEAVPTHVLVESYSVLTRLPPPHRIAPADAAAAITACPFAALSLPDRAFRQLIAHLAAHQVRGGATYDALIAATAAHHKLTLVTRDRRARPTCDALGVAYVVA